MVVCISHSGPSPLPLDQCLGLGLASLGRPGYINLGHGGDLPGSSVEVMRENCWQVLDAAYAHGVR